MLVFHLEFNKIAGLIAQIRIGQADIPNACSSCRFENLNSQHVFGKVTTVVNSSLSKKMHDVNTCNKKTMAILGVIRYGVGQLVF